MKNLSIRVKLIGGFSVIALLLLVAGCVGWVGVSNITSTFRHITDVRLPSVQTLMQIQNTSGRMMSIQRILLTPRLEAQTVEEFHYTLDTLENRFNTLWTQYDALEHSGREKKLWQLLQENRKQRDAINSQFMALSRQLLATDILAPVRFKRDLEMLRSEYYKLIGDVGNMLQSEIEFKGGDDYSSSKLGTWIASHSTKNTAIQKILDDMESPLKAFYSAIAEAKQAIRRGDADAASFLYEVKIIKASTALRKQLDLLIAEADKAEALYQNMATLIMVDDKELSAKSSQIIAEMLELNSQAVASQTEDAVEYAQVLNSVSLYGTGGGFLLALLIGITLTRNITSPLFKGIEFAHSVAGGDLSATLDIRQKDESGVLADSLRTMVTTLKGKIQESEERSAEAKGETLKAEQALAEAEKARSETEDALYQGKVQAAGVIQEIVQHISSSTEQFSEQIDSIRHGATQQRDRSAHVAQYVQDAHSMIQTVAENAQHVSDQSIAAGEQVQKSTEQVMETVSSITVQQHKILELSDSMRTLEERTGNITSVLSIVLDIADQINLLALNAAIEAARAGEAGKGFSVVADEVRKLAAKTLTATQSVQDTIEGIQKHVLSNVQATRQVAEGMTASSRLAEHSGQRMEEILKLVEENTHQVQNIALLSKEQAAGSETIRQAMDEVHSIAVSTSDGVSICASSISGLVGNAGKLKDLVKSMQQR